MANIKATVTPQNKILVTNYAINATTIRFGDIFDVNTSTATDGSLLVYNGGAQVWEASAELNNANTIINGGNF